MELQLVSKKVAVLAKELGFDWHCDKMYGNQVISQLESYNETKYHLYRDYELAPEQELLAKWLRDVHKIYISISKATKNNMPGFCYYIDSKLTASWNVWNTYEEALEEGLLETLTIIKSKVD